MERQLTFSPYNHILTNTGVWSHDGNWIYFDVRTDPNGDTFDGKRIERVEVATGKVEVVYETKHGAYCGVVTANPVDDRIVFMLGPEHPADDWKYSAWHRCGLLVDPERKTSTYLDGRNVVAPYTAGALRGGSHVHVFSGDGKWISYTYEDHVLATSNTVGAALNQRNVGVAAPVGPVMVPSSHPRNQDGATFNVLVTETVDDPRPGTDEICKAYEDAWIGTNGYERRDGSRQQRALAFLGDVVTSDGRPHTELFIVDLPLDITVAHSQPLEGTETTRPAPPGGARQRRLTYTIDRRHGGVSGPRHWPRSSPDGKHIAFLMRDDEGIVQLWLVSPNGGSSQQLTRNDSSIESSFTWSPDGATIAAIVDGSVCTINAETGTTTPLVEHCRDGRRPRPLACVFSPDGSNIAYVRRVASSGCEFNQIFFVEA